MEKRATVYINIIVWVVMHMSLGLLLLYALLSVEKFQLTQEQRQKRDIHSSPIVIPSDQKSDGDDGCADRLKRLEAEVQLLKSEVKIILTCFGAVLSIMCVILRYYGILRTTFLVFRNVLFPREQSAGVQLQQRLNPDTVD